MTSIILIVIGVLLVVGVLAGLSAYMARVTGWRQTLMGLGFALVLTAVCLAGAVLIGIGVES
jgi:hypothetical protein